MDLERRCMRVGIWVIAFSVAVRLVSSGLGGQARAFFSRPETNAFLLYLHTGRRVELAQPQTLPTEETQPTQPTQPTQSTQPTQPTLPPAPSAPEQPLWERPAFAPEDADLVQIKYHAQLQPDLSALLCTSLDWELNGDEPTVLIYHSHATESYTPSAGEVYQESSAYRTLDTDYNMVSVGDRLAQLLREQGIAVIHDRTLHDSPSYSAAYSSSRRSVQVYLKEYPSIRLVIDLHRDALDSPSQLDTHGQVDGKASAQLMLVVGTDAGGLTHPAWQENLALALKFHVILEQTYPGITRPISFRTQRFNQDLSPGAMLIEVGGAGDSHAEALVAAEALAQAITVLAHGSR